MGHLLWQQRPARAAQEHRVGHRQRQRPVHRVYRTVDAPHRWTRRRHHRTQNVRAQR